MTEKPEYDDDEISLLDIYEFFASGWKTLVGGAVLGGVIGTIAAFMIPPKFQATGIIEIAAVGSVSFGRDANSTTMTTKPVETQAVLAEKMKSPTYYSERTIRACDLADAPNPRQALAQNLKPTVQRGGAFVSVSYEALSVEVAKACLQSVIEDVRAQQAVLAAPTIEMTRNTISNLESRLSDIQKTIKQYPPADMRLDFTDPKFSAAALLLDTLLKTEKEASEIKNSIAMAHIALAPPQTQETSFVTPVFAPNQKVSPSRALIIAMGLIIGGALGMLVLMVARMKKRLQAERSATYIAK